MVKESCVLILSSMSEEPAWTGSFISGVSFGSFSGLGFWGCERLAILRTWIIVRCGIWNMEYGIWVRQCTMMVVGICWFGDVAIDICLDGSTSSSWLFMTFYRSPAWNSPLRRGRLFELEIDWWIGLVVITWSWFYVQDRSNSLTVADVRNLAIYGVPKANTVIKFHLEICLKYHLIRIGHP